MRLNFARNANAVYFGHSDHLATARRNRTNCILRGRGAQANHRPAVLGPNSSVPVDLAKIG